jgi:hypothetical protein
MDRRSGSATVAREAPPEFAEDGLSVTTRRRAALEAEMARATLAAGHAAAALARLCRSRSATPPQLRAAAQVARETAGLLVGFAALIERERGTP